MMRTHAALALLLGSLVAAPGGAGAAEGHLADAVNRNVLRVCATPANLPYSDEKGEGFENKIAQLVSDELKRAKVENTWFPQGVGFVRKTLSEKRCDLIMGTVQADEFTLNTNPYYRTTYALVTKPGSDLEGVTSILDPKLKGKRVGIQAGAPAADYVAKAGLMQNAKSYLFIVDTRYQNPMQDMVNDVRSGEIDVGILWGPHAGWYAKQGGEKLNVQPMLEEKQPGLPRLEYRITMGVRVNETAWKHEINNVIAKRQGDIDKILLDYGVPIIDEDNKLITEPRYAKSTN
ncbi:substrate-binding domain-containing protein [Hyphomicrobium sp.]|uniref:substrate-binding domain-containing protein n=1 Tax=Hyphomicrobium sp. TaxID=82 RepID=UPI002E3542FF|nr:substrate-binding domain-containing protein [Hyphomicrobium sp.]HEX2841128.1 substrate-binding domain-containing protein [Hyphomicrobium sp.]